MTASFNMVIPHLHRPQTRLVLEAFVAKNTTRLPRREIERFYRKPVAHFQAEIRALVDAGFLETEGYAGNGRGRYYRMLRPIDELQTASSEDMARLRDAIHASHRTETPAKASSRPTRATLERDVEAWLAAGNRITELPNAGCCDGGGTPANARLTGGIHYWEL